MRRAPGRAGGPLHTETGESRLRPWTLEGDAFADIGTFTRAGESHEGRVWEELPPVDPTALPFLDAQGEVVIPLNAPRKYRWWAGGQSVAQTLRELHGAA